MTRSIKKGPFVHSSLVKQVLNARKASSKKPIKTWSRSSMIIPDMVSLTIAVHNGREFVPVLISEDMVGYRLGEFAPTRLFKSHSGDKKTK